MKILFDTNVLIAAFVTRGQTFDLLKDALYKHDVYCTDFVQEELKKVFNKKFPQLSETSRRFALHVVEKYFLRGKTASTVEPICRDANDDPILADAVTNQINLLITGDKDLLILKKHKSVRILSPAQYWAL